MEDLNQTEKKVQDTFNDLKEAYDKSWDPKNHTLHVGLFKSNEDSLDTAFKNTNIYLKELIDKYLPITKDSHILDVCTGTGRTLLKLTKECTGIGIDISKEQIKDAQEHNNGNCTFLVASASSLKENLPNQKFTHIISQDGIFLVFDKKKCLQDIYDMLKPGGMFVFSDFLAQVSKEEIEVKRKEGVYKTIKWERGISFKEYVKVLKDLGFTILHSETRGEDMIKTYSKLIPQTQHLLSKDKKVCQKLVSRYQSIVDSVKDKELEWGWFVVRK